MTTRICKNKKQAEKMANDLAAELGDGWEPRVWENLGWCYCARLRVGEMGFSVSGPNYEHDLERDDKYSCYGSRNTLGGHSSVFGDVPRGSTPLEAFEKCVQQIEDYLKEVNALHELGNKHLPEKIVS